VIVVEPIDSRESSTETRDGCGLNTAPQRLVAQGAGGYGMTTPWKCQTLEDACQFSNGLWKGEKPPFVHVGVIRNTNFTKEGALDDSDIAYLDVEAKKLEKRSLQFGDVILEKSGGGPKQPVGRVVLFDKTEGIFSFSNFTAALRVRDSKSLDFRFLHKFLHWTYVSGITEGMQSHSTGIRNLDGDAYKAIKIKFPPLVEQQRIVTLLDEAFDGIATAKAHAEKNLQNARELFGSHLQSVFAEALTTGKLVTLADLATDISDGDHMPPPKAPTGVPFITIGNIIKDTREIDFSDTFMVPREYFDKLKPNKRPMKGDVLYTVTGSFGIPVLLKEDREFCFQRHIGLVRPKLNVNSNWLYYLLMSPQILQQANEGATGTAQKTVSLKQLRGYRVPLIPFEVQQTIAAKLDSLSAETQRLEAVYQQKLTALDELKKSLLHRAFNGDL
jgi:type I restriction enzyme S subunit